MSDSDGLEYPTSCEWSVVLYAMRRAPFRASNGLSNDSVWAAEMASPLWQASVSMAGRVSSQARLIDSRVRSLGANGTFLWADSGYAGPASGLTVELAQASVAVSAINTDRTELRFSGLPAGFALSAGDRFSIEWAAGRFYMAELSEGRIATSAGVIASVDVYPFPPLGLMVGKAVNLVRPTFKAMVPPNGYTPFTYQPGSIAQGASLNILQKV